PARGSSRSPARRPRGARAPGRPGSCPGRQQEGEGRAAALFGGRPDGSAMLLDDAAGDGQPEPGSAELRRVVRLEDDLDIPALDRARADELGDLDEQRVDAPELETEIERAGEPEERLERLVQVLYLALGRLQQGDVLLAHQAPGAQVLDGRPDDGQGVADLVG